MKHILIQPSVAVFGHSWTTYHAYDTTGIPDVILKPMQSDLVVWQVIFGPNFRLIDQHLY